MPPANSTMLELGTPLPAFDLPDFGANGNDGAVRVSRDTIPADKPVLVAFICNHCPFVVHIEQQLAAMGNDFADTLTMIAISANNPDTHPADAPNKMTEKAHEVGYTFPYLFDETQETAHAFSARCTPDFFLFDATHKLVYRGQLDASRPSNAEPVTGADLRAAITATREGTAITTEQIASLGCGIKWKPGNEPS